MLQHENLFQPKHAGGRHWPPGEIYRARASFEFSFISFCTCFLKIPLSRPNPTPELQPSNYNRHSFNDLHFHSNDANKVIDTQCTSVLFFLVFANQNLCRSASRTPAALRPPQFRHREKKHVSATPLVPANYKCPLAQILSLHILTNAPGYGVSAPILKVLL